MNTTAAINAAITELSSTISTLGRFPETDTAATVALLSATTARACLRDALDAAAPANGTAPRGVACTSRILFELWERAAPSLNRESLEWFAGATGQAEHVTACLKNTVEVIGCLIAHDDCTQGGTTYDVPQVLFSIANDLDNINALLLVGDSASYRLRKP